MAYEPQTWADGAAGGTPISAARLNHIEQGLVDVELTPGPKGDKGDTGDPGTPGFPTQAQWDALVARVVALENPEG